MIPISWRALSDGASKPRASGDDPKTTINGETVRA